MAYTQAIQTKYFDKALAHFKTLNPSTKGKMQQLFSAVFNELGILLNVHSSYRGLPEQWELRKKWLAGTGGKAAKPGSSWHNFKRAIDVVPVTATGGADWNSPNWNKIGAIANRLGIKWGASFGDKPHFYDDTGTSLSLLRSQTPDVEKYAQLESQLKAPASKKEAPNVYVEEDNKALGWTILKWGALAALLGIGIYKGNQYVQHRRLSK